MVLVLSLRRVWVVTMAIVFLIAPGMVRASDSGGINAVVAEIDHKNVTLSEFKEYVGDVKTHVSSHMSEKSQRRLRSLFASFIGELLVKKYVQQEKIEESQKFKKIYGIARNRFVANRYLKYLREEAFTRESLGISSIFKKGKNSWVKIISVVSPTRADAEEAVKALKRGTPFREVIDRYSLVKNDRALRRRIVEGLGDYGEAWEREVFRHGKGEIVGPIKSGAGYLVVRIEDKGVVSKEEAEKLEAIIVEKKKSEKIGEVIKKLREKEEYKLYEKNLLHAARKWCNENRLLHEPILNISGEEIFFDEFVISMKQDLRGIFKESDSSFLVNLYRQSALNYVTAFSLAKDARQRLRWSDIDDDTEREFIRKKILTEMVGWSVVEENEKRVYPAEKEIEEFYEENKVKLFREPRAKVKRITFKDNEEYQEFRGKLKEKVDVYELITKYEKAKDSVINHRNEWVTKRSVGEEIIVEILNAGKNGVTRVVDFGDGGRGVFYVERVEKNYIRPLSEVKPQIVRILFQRKYDDVFSEFLSKLEKKFEVKIYDDVLDNYLKGES